MALPLKPPIEPQLALSRKKLPDDEGWAYEPKYDGFRALAFVDDDERLPPVAKRPAAARATSPSSSFPAGRYVLDGELRDPRRRRRARSSTRSRTASTRPSRGCDMLAEKTPALLPRLRPARRAATKRCSTSRSRERRDGGGAALDSTGCRADRGLDRADRPGRRPGEAEPWLEGGEGVIAKRARRRPTGPASARGWSR